MPQPGQTFLWPGMSDNREVRIEEVGSGEPDDSAFGNPLSQGRVKLSGRPAGLEDEMVQGSVIETDELRQNIDPREIHMRRSEQAKETDAAMDAELTTDPLQWASSPDDYDFPGVDTGPTFRESEGDNFDAEGFLDSLF